MHVRWTWFGGLTLFTCVGDQLSKYWARSSLPTNPYGFGIRVPVIENFFDWRLSYNTGASFSVFADSAWARPTLTVLAMAALAGIVWMVHRSEAERRLVPAALGLIAGGALGNLIDRIRLGKVTDFVLWRYYEHEWPIFNLADAALCVGAVLLLLNSLRRVPAPRHEPAA
jgi:signal peptidase II